MLHGLQAGRAIAVLSAAAYHLSHTMGIERYGGQTVFTEYTGHGNRGVDFFFVLSGFIILLAHWKDIGKPHAWTEYAYRRFVRIFPIYWVYTAGFCLLLALGAGTDAKMPTHASDWLTSLSLIRFSDWGPPLPVSWTLFHEVAFYLVFSLLILNRRVGVAAFVIWACACVALYHYPGATSRTPFAVYTAAFNLYFLFGMGACWLYRQGGRGFAEFIIGGCITIAALMTMPLPHEISPMILVLGFSLLITGAAKMEQSGSLKVPGWLVFVGNASYTIYLIHEALQGLLLKVALRTPMYKTLGPEWTYIVIMLVMTGVGCAVYFTVEKPMLASIQQWRKSRRKAVGVATAAT